MSISYDNSMARRVLNGTSFSFTTATGAHMFVVTEAVGGITAITYGGVALTKIISFEPSIHDGNQVKVWIWELVSPASGANNFVITAGVDASAFGVITFVNARTIQPDNENDQFSNNGINNTQVAGFTSVTNLNSDSCWPVTFIVGGNNAPIDFVAGASTTLRATIGSSDTQSIGILDRNTTFNSGDSPQINTDWAIGSGFVSTVTLAIRGITVPSAPTIGTATTGIGSATVSFTPGDNGGSAITGYTVTSSPGGLTATGASSPITITGLSGGVSYTFTVHATNAIGNSAESASTSATTLQTGMLTFFP